MSDRNEITERLGKRQADAFQAFLEADAKEEA